MRACSSVNAFAICLGLFAIIYGSFDTYLISMLTTLERRFSLPSKLSGLLQGSTDFGYLLGVLPVSYFGRSGHRPRTLGVLGVVLAVGILIMCIPYLVFGPLKLHPAGSSSSSSSSSSLYEQQVCNANSTNSMKDSLQTENALAFAILVGGAFTVGIGSTPFWNLGLAYIDDHVTKVQAPVYLSAMMALRFVAPLPGYIIGGQIAEIPEDLGDRRTEKVGAWWLGFLCLSAMIAGCSLLMFCFPRYLTKPKVELQVELQPKQNGDASDTAHCLAEGQESVVVEDKAKEALNVASVMSLASLGAGTPGADSFFVTLRRLFHNATFVCLLLGAALEFLAFMGFLAFLPKYYQVSFGTSDGMASLFAGLVEGLSSAIGTLAGGIFMNRTSLSLRKLLVCITIVCLAAGGMGNVGAAMRCRDTPPFVSADVGASCSSACRCTNEQFSPICIDTTSFLSPCLAGCNSFTSADNGSVMYSDCGCPNIPMLSESSPPAAAAAAAAAATNGLCISIHSCVYMLVAYNSIFFVLNFLAGAVKSIVCIIVIRSISAEDKDIGFGFVTFVASFSSTVSPMLYGALIDAFCLHRQGGGTSLFGHCQVYDVAGIRVSQHMMRGCLRMLCGLAFVAASIAARNNPHIRENSRKIQLERRRNSAAENRNGN